MDKSIKQKWINAGLNSVVVLFQMLVLAYCTKTKRKNEIISRPYEQKERQFSNRFAGMEATDLWIFDDQLPNRMAVA